MDFQPEMMEPETPYVNKRNDRMATASFVLGLIALLTCGCIYSGMICGALGMILALLSRGGEMKLNIYGKIGLILSTAGLILSITFFVLMFVYLLNAYGGIDGIMQEYMNILGVDTIDELYQTMGY